MPCSDRQTSHDTKFKKFKEIIFESMYQLLLKTRRDTAIMSKNHKNNGPDCKEME
jgi:hypothetical protein